MVSSSFWGWSEMFLWRKSLCFEGELGWFSDIIKWLKWGLVSELWWDYYKVLLRVAECARARGRVWIFSQVIARKNHLIDKPWQASTSLLYSNGFTEKPKERARKKKSPGITSFTLLAFTKRINSSASTEEVHWSKTNAARAFRTP